MIPPWTRLVFLTLALIGGGGENPLRFFEESEKRRHCVLLFIVPYQVSFPHISPPGHLRSDHKVRSIDPTS